MAAKSLPMELSNLSVFFSFLFLETNLVVFRDWNRSIGATRLRGSFSIWRFTIFDLRSKLNRKRKREREKKRNNIRLTIHTAKRRKHSRPAPDFIRFSSRRFETIEKEKERNAEIRLAGEDRSRDTTLDHPRSPAFITARTDLFRASIDSNYHRRTDVIRR